MKEPKIPDQIAKAATALLRDFVPGLTPERLESAFQFEPRADDLEKLLTRKEAAAALNISMPTLDRSLRDGSITKRRIRGSVRIPESAVLAIVTGKAEGSD